MFTLETSNRYDKIKQSFLSSCLPACARVIIFLAAHTASADCTKTCYDNYNTMNEQLQMFVLNGSITDVVAIRKHQALYLATLLQCKEICKQESK